MLADAVDLLVPAQSVKRQSAADVGAEIIIAQTHLKTPYEALREQTTSGARKESQS